MSRAGLLFFSLTLCILIGPRAQAEGSSAAVVDCEEVLAPSANLKITDDFRVLWKNQIVPLSRPSPGATTSPMFRLLRFLAENPHPLSADEIYEEVWQVEDYPDSFVHTVRKTVERLRKSFLSVDPEFDCIKAIVNTSQYTWTCSDIQWRNFGQLRLSPGYSASWREKKVEFAASDFRVVQALVESGGRVVGFDRLMELLQNSEGAFFEEDHRALIRTHISHIRQSFRKADPEFDCLQTVISGGYRWTCLEPHF